MPGYSSDENQRKHLDIIQGVITRLAGNSFSIKTWAVGLITVLGGLAAKDANLWFALALVLPALCFWGLDAFYLRQERLFRKLYATAADGTGEQFSMDVSGFAATVQSVPRIMFSATIAWLHIPVVIFVAALIAYAICRPPQPPAQPAATSAVHAPEPDRR